MPIDKAIHNMAQRGIKESAKRRDLERQREIDDAQERLDRLIAKARTHGAHEKDPLHILCIVACYGKRPVVFGKKLVLNIHTNKKGHRSLSPDSIVVGEIEFLPLGGIGGMWVKDRQGHLMICDGICRKGINWDENRWSFFTRGFHLLKQGQL